jgi:hypothetical protein
MFQSLFAERKIRRDVPSGDEQLARDLDVECAALLM